MYEVDEQAFDVRSIVVLVCHDHYWPITQTLSVVVFLADLQTHNLSKICDLLIIWDLLHVCLSYIQKFSAKRETTIKVSAYYFDACKSQRFSWVTLSQNQSAAFWIFRAGLVCIIKLLNSKKLNLFFAVILLSKFCFLFRFCHFENNLDDARVQNRFHKRFTDFVGRSKVSSLSIQRLLGLTVKCRIGNQTVHENPQVLLDLMRFYIELLLIFCCDFLDDLFDNLICDVLNMSASFGCADRIYKWDLLKSTITQTANHFPPIALFLSNLWQSFVLFIF